MADRRRVYLDTCVYLDVLLGDNVEVSGRFQISSSLLSRGLEDDYHLVASTQVWLEIAGNGDIRTGRVKDRDSAVRHSLEDLFESGRLTLVSLDPPVARLATKISAEYGLRGADAAHLASAIWAGCDTFMTWNSKDFRGLYGQTIEGVLVAEPELWGQQRLID